MEEFSILFKQFCVIAQFLHSNENLQDEKLPNISYSINRKGCIV